MKFNNANELMNSIDEVLLSIKKFFKYDTNITLLIRSADGNRERDLIFTDDDLEEAVNSINIRRAKGEKGILAS